MHFDDSGRKWPFLAAKATIQKMLNGGAFHLEPFLGRAWTVKNPLLTTSFGGDALNCTLLHAEGQPSASK